MQRLSSYGSAYRVMLLAGLVVLFAQREVRADDAAPEVSLPPASSAFEGLAPPVEQQQPAEAAVIPAFEEHPIQESLPENYVPPVAPVPEFPQSIPAPGADSAPSETIAVTTYRSNSSATPTSGSAPGVAGTDTVGDIEETGTSESSMEEEEVQADDRKVPISLSYFGILYGPSLSNPTSDQPTPYGDRDRDRPITVRNYATLAYNLNNDISVAATGYWWWRPVRGQELIPKDPFVRVAYNGWLRNEHLNVYSDIRFHVPITKISRANDMKLGVQNFNAIYYGIPSTSWSLGLYGSIRYNVFGSMGGSLGWGNDSEFYLAPNVSYQISRKVSFTLLYEMAASHTFGNAPLQLDSDGTSLEPGVNWDITPQISMNPFLNIPTGGKVNLNSTSWGMTLSWLLL